MKMDKSGYDSWNSYISRTLAVSNQARSFAVHISTIGSNYAVRKQNTVILYLQPTSPLRDETHIDSALKAMDTLKLV